MSEETTARPSVRRAPPWPVVAMTVVAVGLLAAFPPFRVRSRQAVGAEAGSAAAFEPGSYASTFWNSQLLPAVGKAIPLSPLLEEIRRDPVAAARVQGHRAGLGSAAYYFAQGKGRVTAIERGRVIVTVDDHSVAIRTGPVFGNTIRDGCGLLEVNKVPGLAEYNALSAELNRIVETKIQPTLKTGATVGSMLSFAGCAEAPESIPSASEPLLTFIPVQVEVAP